MKIRTNRIAPLALATALAFGVAACEVEDDPDGTTVVDDDDGGVVEEGDDTVIEEGDETTIEEGDETTVEEGSTETDTSTESEG